MEAKLLSVVATLVLLSVAPLAIADAPVEEDRELNYAGTTRFDHGLNQVCDDATGGCPVVVPSGITSSVCDYDADGMDGTGIHGIGGGIFCDILKGGTVTVTLNDELLESPSASITCPSHQETTGVPPTPATDEVPILTVTWHQGLGDATPSLTTEVLEDCWSPPGTKDEREDLTNIGVFMNIGEATAGSASLVHE